MTAAIIVTAGRMSGEPHFRPNNLEGISVLNKQIHTFRHAGVEEVIVIHGKSEKDIKSEAAHNGATPLSVGDDANMLDGVKHAIEFVRDRYGRLLITHRDAPLFLADTVHQLMNTDAELAVPTKGGKPQQPIMLADSLYDSLLFIKSEEGLEGFIRDCRSLLKPVAEQEEDIHAYVGGAGNGYRLGLCSMRPAVRLSIGRDKSCFGPLTQMLTQLIDETGSLREACRYMNISTGRGWQLIEQSEQVLGFQLVTRKNGVANAAFTSLTPEGRELSIRYKEYVDECKQAMDDIFQNKFGDFIAADCNRRSSRSEFRLP